MCFGDGVVDVDHAVEVVSDGLVTMWSLLKSYLPFKM